VAPTSSHSQKLSVNLREFEPKDLATLTRWYHAHNINAPTMDDLPAFGLVAELPAAEGSLWSIMLAAGFLVETDTNTCIVDFFVANPEASREARGFAIDAVCEGLEASARIRGYSKLKCDTRLETIKHRALKHGCLPIGEFSVFLKGL
jgi:hypothetical protein